MRQICIIYACVSTLMHNCMYACMGVCMHVCVCCRVARCAIHVCGVVLARVRGWSYMACIMHVLAHASVKAFNIWFFVLNL